MGWNDKQQEERYICMQKSYTFLIHVKTFHPILPDPALLVIYPFLKTLMKTEGALSFPGHIHVNLGLPDRMTTTVMEQIHPDQNSTFYILRLLFIETLKIHKYIFLKSL